MRSTGTTRRADARNGTGSGRNILLGTHLLLLAYQRGVALTFPSPSPDFECPYDIDDLRSCLTENGLNFTACAECQFSYHDSLTNGTTCGDITDIICERFVTCYVDCGPCGEQIEVIETCSWGYECFRSCPYMPWLTPPNPTLPPVPAPTPTSFPVPAAPLPTSFPIPATPPASFPVSAPSLTAFPVPAPSPTLFPVPATPPVSFPVPAPAPASFPIPTPSRCADEVQAFASCVVQTGDLPSCYACFDANIPDRVSTCSASRAYVCAADEICPMCGSCQDAFEAVINCANGGQCEAFDCSGSSPASRTRADTCLFPLIVGMTAVALCTL